jgi:hypothetical protein
MADRRPADWAARLCVPKVCYANEIAPRSVTPQPIAFHSTAVFRSVGSNMGQVALVRALALIATLWDKLLMSAVWLEAFIAGISSVAASAYPTGWPLQNCQRAPTYLTGVP